MNKLPAQKVDGLIHGMALLQELASEARPMSGLELSKRLEMSPVRVNRLLKTLAYLGYASQTVSRKYVVGPAVHVIAAQTMKASGLLRYAFEYLELLNHEAPTVALGVLWKQKVCYLYHKSATIQIYEGIGGASLYDADNSSVGLALLAELSDPAIHEIYGDANIEALMERITETRANGYALLRHGEHYSMAMKIGVPSYAALAVSGIKEKKQLEPLRAKLSEYSQKIQEKGELKC